MATYNVLVIDDDPNIRKLLTELLNGRPEYRVLMAGEGSEAVRYFAEEKIDVVLTDIHMPGFTGIELMADMKKLKFQPEILIMTANGTPENVEKARQIGARSVILKPFDNLDVVEAEIDKAIRAVAEARAANGNGHGDAAAAPGPQAVTASPAKRAVAPPPKAATAPPKPPPAPAVPPRPVAPDKPAAPATAKPAAGPALSTMKIDANALRAHGIAAAAPRITPAAPAPAAKPAPPARAAAPPPRPIPPPKPIPVAKFEPESDASPAEGDASDAIAIDMDAESAPDLDSWRMEVTGNDTPEPESPLAAARRKAMGDGQVGGAPPAPAKPAPAKPAPKTAPPAAVAPAPGRPVAAKPAPFPKRAAPDPAPDETESPVTEAPSGENAPAIPEELQSVLRAATGLDAGRMKMHVPIVCLQTWEEQSAIAALRALSAELEREFFCWSAARGLLKEGGQAMGEMYRDPIRALEFIRRHKVNGLYVLADFRRCLEDRTVVRELREMVMEGETARALLVLTDPRLMMPPELTASSVQFDWPGSEAVDLESVYEEVMAEASASSGKAIRLSREERQALFDSTREMSAGRARFEIARALMARSRRAG